MKSATSLLKNTAEKHRLTSKKQWHPTAPSRLSEDDYYDKLAEQNHVGEVLEVPEDF